MAGTVYCDEHFGPDIVNDFVHQGASIGLRAELFRTHKNRALDDEQLFFAAQKNWTILTRDADFRDLHVLWHVLGLWRRRRPALDHSGILWITSGQSPHSDRQAEPGQTVIRDLEGSLVGASISSTG